MLNEKILAAIEGGIKKYDEIVLKKTGGKIVVVAVERKVICRG